MSSENREINLGDDKIITDLKPIDFGNGDIVEPVGNGGMATRQSLERLTGKVAFYNGIGTIGLTGISHGKGLPQKEYINSNIIEARKVLNNSKEIANGKGIICANVLSSTPDAREICTDEEVASTAKLIFTGAGIDPTIIKGMMDKYGDDKNFATIAPIASSIKVLNILNRIMGRLKYKAPTGKNVFYLESSEKGNMAGGHNGLLKPQGYGEDMYRIEKIAEELQKLPYRDEIIVLLGGGIVDYNDVKRAQDYGFDGAISGTAFLNTHESPASDYHKQLITNAKPEDITTFLSAVGYWATGFKTPFLDRLIKEGKTVEIIEYLKNPLLYKEMYDETKKNRECYTKCLEKCGNFCILNSLISAGKGNSDNGLYFAGQCSHRVGKTTSVQKRMKILLEKQ